MKKLKRKNSSGQYILIQSEHSNTAQKNKFSDKDFFSKCEQIYSFLRICSNLLKKSLIENFFFFFLSKNFRVPFVNEKILTI